MDLPLGPLRASSIRQRLSSRESDLGSAQNLPNHPAEPLIQVNIRPGDGSRFICLIAEFQSRIH